MSHRIIAATALLALFALACGANITLPSLATLGPDQTNDIAVPAPGGEESRLAISFGGGNLTLAPGAQQLVEGTATYNVPDLKPQIVTQGNSIEIKQGDLRALPNPSGIRNDWNFKLGSMSMALAVSAGAYKGVYDLGGLSLTEVTIKDGASTVDLAFSSPNKADMTLLRYETGASTVKLRGLANANFSTMVFNGGAGDYTLDFSGTLKRAATITISTGISNLIVVVPPGVQANATVEGGASNISAGPGWTQTGNSYSQSGTGPALTFIIKTGAGNLTLTH